MPATHCVQCYHMHGAERIQFKTLVTFDCHVRLLLQIMIETITILYIVKMKWFMITSFTRCCCYSEDRAHPRHTFIE